MPPGHGPLPASLSLVTLTGAHLELTSLKRSEEEGCLVVRFYNDGQSATLGKIDFGLPMRRVHKATAEEQRLGRLDPAEGGYALEVQPGEHLHAACGAGPGSL